MIIELIDCKSDSYRIQKLEDKTLLKILPSQYEINNSLIVQYASNKNVILFSFLLAKIIRISLEDYNKYIKQFSHHIFVPKILLDLNIIVPKTNSSQVPHSKYYFRNLQLNLTPNCNLRCRYCYAMAGRRKNKFSMSWEIAKASIDFVSQYCGDTLHLIFVGEGEPTIEFPLLKKIYLYAKKKVPGAEINPLSTNGVISKKIADWLIKNVKELQVSCDGPAFIQNKYRPLVNGKGSSAFVEKTIKYFVKNNKKFRVRATITDDYFGNELKIINYFWNLGVKDVSFGGLENIGAAKNINQKLKFKQSEKIYNLFEVLKEMQKLIELQNEVGMKIRSLNFSLIGTTITCGIYYKSNFVVDPFGYVSACDRYNDLEDFKENPFMRDFIIGNYDFKIKQFKIDFKKLDDLKKKIDTQLQIQGCHQCSVKSACSTICLYDLGQKTGTISPSFSVCGEPGKMAPTINFDYLIKRYLINKKPCLEYKKGKLFYSLLYTEFELSISKNGSHLAKNPYILIDDLNNLKELAQKIINYKKSHEELIVFLLNFQIKQEFRNKIYARKIINFLKQLKNNRVYFKITEPLPKEMFSENYDAFCEEFDIPKTYKDSLELYRVANDTVYFSKNIIGNKKFSEYEDRNEIYEDYQKLLA